jgi:phosphate-selective porin OprO/OprP
MDPSGGPALATASPSIGDTLENLGRVLGNDSNQYMQELWLLGRFQGQYHWTEASSGEDDGYETRRFRLGGQARMYRHMTIHAQMVSGSDIDPLYNGFTELWAQWAFSPEFAITLGQQKNRFTHDRNVSSRYLNYLERGLLTNMFNADYTPAVTAQGKLRSTSYYAGVFTNSTGQNIGDAFTEFDSGYSYLGTIYQDLGQTLWADSVTLYLAYLHSKANQNATNLDRFDEGLSGAFVFYKGRAAVVTEVVAGLASDDGDAVGLNFQPSYFINNELQLVARYQAALSDSAHGLQPQRRYEKEVGFAAGELYQAGYLGLNYYIAKHRLKLMTGLEYAAMDSQEAWTASAMLRFYFGPHSAATFAKNEILPHESD